MLSGQQASLRDGVIYGYFGKSVNYTDGKRTYFRAAATPENRPLNVYTAIPTTLRQYYGVGCIAPEDYCKIRHSSYLAWDRVHPNQIGATLMAKEFLSHCGYKY